MGKILILINGVGLILNVLVFIIVVHYFEGVESDTAGEAAAPELVTKAQFDQHAARISRSIDDLKGRFRTLANDVGTKVSAKLAAEIGSLQRNLADLSRELRKLTADVEPVDAAPPPEEDGAGGRAADGENGGNGGGG